MAVVGRPLDHENELVERARRGDAAAYEELVRLHEHVAYRTALVFSASPADAQDAAQEALLKAWRALPRFRAGAPFRPWLLAIVANEARSRVRGARRAARARPDGPRSALPARALRGGDGGGAGLPPRDGQVTRLAGASADAHEHGGGAVTHDELRDE